MSEEKQEQKNNLYKMKNNKNSICAAIPAVKQILIEKAIDAFEDLKILAKVIGIVIGVIVAYALVLWIANAIHPAIKEILVWLSVVGFFPGLILLNRRLP